MRGLLPSAAMKFLVPTLIAMLLAGCNSNMATHRRDFSPVKKSGPWNDYYSAVKKGEKPEPPKEAKP